MPELRCQEQEVNDYIILNSVFTGGDFCVWLGENKEEFKVAHRSVVTPEECTAAYYIYSKWCPRKLTSSQQIRSEGNRSRFQVNTLYTPRKLEHALVYVALGNNWSHYLWKAPTIFNWFSLFSLLGLGIASLFLFLNFIIFSFITQSFTSFLMLFLCFEYPLLLYIIGLELLLYWFSNLCKSFSPDKTRTTSSA